MYTMLATLSTSITTSNIISNLHMYHIGKVFIRNFHPRPFCKVWFGLEGSVNLHNCHQRWVTVYVVIELLRQLKKALLLSVYSLMSSRGKF